MENSTPYMNLPLSVQSSSAHNGNDAQQMAPPTSQGLLNFLPAFHNTDKGGMDLHGFNVVPSENIHAEDLHSSFKMNESCNLIFDPFSTEPQLNTGTLTVRHDLMHNDKHSSVNDFTSTNSNAQPCSTTALTNCLETSLASHQTHEQQISLSSHIFSKTLESSLNESLDFHSSLAHVPLDSGPQFQELERSIPLEADNSHCEENFELQEFNPSSVTHSVDQNLGSSDKLLCDACDHTFAFEIELLDHKKHVHGINQEKRNEYIFTCALCPKAFRTEEQLSKHEARHPYKTSAIQCSKCGEILGNYMLLQEHKQSEDYLSSCDICGQLFPNEECMICHIRNAHNDFEDFMEEECTTSQGHMEPAPLSIEDTDNTDINQGCLPENISLDENPQLNLSSQEPAADEGQVDERLATICNETSVEHSDVQNKSLTHPIHFIDQSRNDVSAQEKNYDLSNELETSNSDPFVCESAVPEADTECPEDKEESGTACEVEEPSLNYGNGSGSDSSEPEKMQCRYCSKKCSTRKSLIRHERCHPYETAAMKCNLCLEVVDSYKLMKIHKKKLAQVACSTCNQLCPNELCLLCHVRNVHNNSVYDVKPIYSVSDDSNDAYNYEEDEDASDDGEQFSLPRYATRNSEGPLRITIKQEREEFDERAGSPTFSAPTPPTPSTPSPQGPPTPSPPQFIPESEPSEEDEDEDDDEYEPVASDDSGRRHSVKASKRKTSMRTTRRSSYNSVQLSSSEGSDHGESSDNYSPEESPVSEEDSDEEVDAGWRQEERSPGSKKKTRRKNPISDDDSEEDPDWGHSQSSSVGMKKKGRRKKGPLSDDSDADVGWRPSKKPSVISRKKARKKRTALSDDDSDDDPDWRKAEIAPVVMKKKRGRPKKVQVAFFVPAIPMPKRPRAKGLGGQKAHDAAAALAQAVVDMETTVPELKTVIRPVRRSVTKASLKRYCEIEDDEYDYLLQVKQEPKEVVEGSEHPQINPPEMSESMSNVSNEISQLSSASSLHQEEEDEEEEVVIKAEPYDFQEDDLSESTDLYFSQKFCEPKYDKKVSKKRDSGDGEIIKREGYACKLCGRGMQYRSHLIRHLRKVHDGEGIEEVMRRMMHCRFCSKPYTNELSLINHEKLHDGTSKMKCNKCDERFDDKNALRRHQRKTHWEHQPVECEICKKQLSDNTCLKAHMKHMHGTEEKKVTVFTCETCGRQLHTKTAFQNHVASKCGTNLLFPCETCGKSFSFKGSLKAHQLLHTGIKSFLCKFCGKAFHQKGEMKRHERKHTGEKPFVCEVCGRAFAYRESLLGHSAVHTGVKPFPCKACGMRFSCSGNLVKHRRSNNCKGFMEPGMEGVGIENSEGNANVNQPVPVVRPVSVIPDNSPKPLNSDCLQSDAQTLLNETPTSSNKVVDQSLEAVQSTVTQAHNQSPNQGAAVSNSSLTAPALSITPMTAPGNAGDVPMLVSRSVNNIPRIASNVPMSEPRSVNNVQMPVCTTVNSSSMSAPMNNIVSADSHSLSVLPMAMASVIKSAPSINVKPTSALQGMPKESRPSAHVEIPQSHGISISPGNRPSGHMNTMYSNHENGVTVQSNYGSHSSTASYNETQIRQSNQVNPNDRRFMQFSMDNYTGRADQYFDRQALMRHEMSRQVTERSTDRSTSRFLDWTGGMQFSGMDSRNSLQSYPSAQISHSTGYPNFHSGHFGNYAASHTTGHSNNHANMYAGNTMMPGGVGFSAFAANNHIGMGYAPNNAIPAHSVAHSSSYPASHMSHLEALFGHFSHAGSNNSFPRLSSHNVGSSANPSLPSNNRV